MTIPYRIRTAGTVALAVFCVYSSWAQVSPAPKLRLTAQQAISLRHLTDLQAAPDGIHMAAVVSEPPKGVEPQGHIWVYNTPSREFRQFTNSSKSESRPRWSPDGQKLAFLSNRDESQNIYLIPGDGGEAKNLTPGKQPIQAFEWSRDGRQIAFLAEDPKTEVEEKKEKDKDDAKSIDRDDRRAHLWLLDVASGKSRPVTGALWHFSALQWLPGGDRLVVVATDHPESDRETNRIFVVTLADGHMQELAAPRGPFGDLQVSPDGSQIAYAGSRLDGPQAHDLFVQPLLGGEPRNLSAQVVDRQLSEFAWRADGKLQALFEDGLRHKFFVFDSSGQAQTLPALRMSVGAFALSKAGTVFLVGENAHLPPEVFTWDGKTDPNRISNFNDSFAHFELMAPEFLRYKSFDGREIEGALLKPSSPTASRLPTVFMIHGGPTGVWQDNFESWGQLLASAGYAVFYPNIRGSTGYGHDFVVLNRGDWGGGDFKDVMAGVDFLIARGIADPNRLGIAGWSYGGYMAEWAITQTTRFKAAVSGAGMSDLATEYGTEEHPAYDEWFYGLPYEKPEGFRRSSPLTYIRNAHTPTLILQGDADTVDPLAQSQMLYRALKRYGVPAELVVYPREGHGLKEEKHLLDRLNRLVGWFDKYLK